MKLFITFFLLISPSFMVLSEIHDTVTVTVEVPLTNTSDKRTVAAAKNKAAIKAMERLPSIIWGTETLRGESYQQTIQAVGFAHTHVSVIDEKYDREGGVYHLNATVSWDMEKVNQMLAVVKEGEKAKAIVKKIASLSESPTLEKYIQSNDTMHLTPLEEASLLANPFFYAGSYSELQQYHLAMVRELAKPVTETLLMIAASIDISLVDADANTLYFDITKPKSDRSITFLSTEIEHFFQKNRQEILDAAGHMCLFSVTEFNRFKWSALNKDDAATIKVAIETQKIGPQHANFLYQQKMVPIDVLICDKASFKDAKHIKYQKEGSSLKIVTLD
jgi:hypothetical protein